LIPGSYTVKVAKEGFPPAVTKGVHVEVARTVSVTTRLQTGHVEEAVEVTASTVTLETTQPEVGWTVEKKVFDELPTIFGDGSRGRQIDTLLQVVPGVTGDSFSHRIN